MKFLFFLTFIFFLSACETQLPREDYGVLEIFIFGIGRADAILITTENHAMLIDTGENRHGFEIAAYLQARGIAPDYLVITHFDSDHVGGAHAIIDAIEIANVIVPNYRRESRHVELFEAALLAAEISPFILTEAKRVSLDGAEFVINPSHTARTPGDEFSIVVSVTHGENSFLFTGDAVSGRLRELLDDGFATHDFLKVPRHGRYTNRSEEFIRAIAPRYAVITGFHPRDEEIYHPERPADERVIASLEDAGTQIFFAMSRAVRVISDGLEIHIEYTAPHTME